MRKTSLTATALLLLLLLAAASCRTAGHTAGNVTVTTTADSGPGSLRDAVANAADGGTITFKIPKRDAGHDAASRTWTITLTGGEIAFGKALTVKGGGKIILDGNGASRILCCESKGTLTLDGLTFQNGKDIGGGGKGGGGAVWSRGAINTTGCTFSGNMISRDYGANGGAVYVQGAATVTRCAFTGNTADCEDSVGGAVFARGVATVTGCVFTDNSAGNSAGAVFAANLTAAGCTFTGNTAPCGGAARGGNVTATDCSFTGNTADGSGGAVDAVTAATVTRCAFTGNSARHGGAVQAFESVTATGCAFTGNTAATGGGAVCASRDVIAADCVFTRNTAMLIGGAVSAGGAAVTRCTFTGNVAAEEQGHGGAVQAFDSVTATGCAFIGNTATRDGGAVSAGKSATATGCAFTGNAADSGGAVHAYKDFVSAANSIFTGNRTGREDSGAVYTKGRVYLFHTTVADNTGTGVCVTESNGDPAPRLHAYNSIIAGNSAAIQAGFGTYDKRITAIPAGDIPGDSLIEGAADGVTRATVFGGIADKTADALTAAGIAVPDGMAAADVIAALRKDITGAPRPVSGKVSYGARE